MKFSGGEMVFHSSREDDIECNGDEVSEEYVCSNVYGPSEELGFKENRSWVVEQSSEC